MLLNRFQIGTKKIKAQKNSPSALEGEPKFIVEKSLTRRIQSPRSATLRRGLSAGATPGDDT